jgi:hypothetical protein
MTKKQKMSKSQTRALRSQQIILGIIGLIVIVAMILSMISSY